MTIILALFAHYAFLLAAFFFILTKVEREAEEREQVRAQLWADVAMPIVRSQAVEDYKSTMHLEKILAEEKRCKKSKTKVQ